MPVVTYQQISSLAEVDFERLFYACIDKLEPTFAFPAHYNLSQKKDLIFGMLQSMIDGNYSLSKEGETLLIHKVVIDGLDVLLLAGYIEADNTIFRSHWLFVGPNSNGSRSWLYSDEYKQALSNYYSSKGIISVRNNMKVGTPIYNHVLSKQAASDYTIIPESIVEEPDHNTMSCIINMP